MSIRGINLVIKPEGEVLAQEIRVKNGIQTGPRQQLVFRNPRGGLLFTGGQKQVSDKLAVGTFFMIQVIGPPAVNRLRNSYTIRLPPDPPINEFTVTFKTVNGLVFGTLDQDLVIIGVEPSENVRVYGPTNGVTNSNYDAFPPT